MQQQQSLWEPATREQRIWGVPRCSLRAKAVTWAIDCIGRRRLAECQDSVVIDDGGDLCLECTLDELVVESGLSRRTVQHGIDDAVLGGILDVDQQTGRPYCGPRTTDHGRRTRTAPAASPCPTCSREA